MEHWQQNLIFAALGWGVASALIFFGWQRRAKARSRSAIGFRLFASLTAGLLLTAAAAHHWYFHRNQPSPVARELFPGIRYVREVRTTPRPVVIHTVTVRLDAPGLNFIVTPGAPGRALPLRARTTSEFAREFDVQLAVNGDFFTPWYSNSPWDFYPRRGDPVKVLGVAAAQGRLYSPGQTGDAARTLFISKSNLVSSARPDAIFNAISGHNLIRAGVVELPLRHDSLEPRTAIGWDRAGKTLFLVVVDGRQPNYSEGMTRAELAECLRREGADDAINLDGGGSTALVLKTAAHKWETLNCPIHTRIPWRERPVANHLGIGVSAAR